MNRCLAMLALVLSALVWSAPAFAAEGPLQTGSRARYSHRINLYDADNTIIDPAERPAQPWATSTSCAKCHSVGVIAGGWHFNAVDESVDPGRPGEPWMLVDAATGTQVPLSQRDWPGTRRPEEFGLTPWDFVMRFGRHLPGGGVGTPPAEVMNDFSTRWGVAGPLEIDCLLCHDAEGRHDPAERGRQIEVENFRWAVTAASPFALVRGEASRLPDHYDPMMPPAGAVPPQVLYDEGRFDADDRVYLDLARRVPADRCYFCHTTSETTPAAAERWQHEGDVHIAAGMSCADCHRHGIDHQVVRGYEGEPERGRGSVVQTLTCRGCHLGTDEDPTSQAVALGGRLGAPRPLHRGLPPIHLEKLSCTACHSGGWPGEQPRMVQTSLAHGLGIAERGRHEQMLPLIQSPVFIRDAGGVIAPHKLVWPAFWGRRGEDGGLEPLAPEAVRRAARLREVEAVQGKPLELAEITRILGVLAADSRASGTPFYLAGGMVHELDEAGELRRTAITPEQAEFQPYAWPLAHDVRPAAQSLGARGCTDCHASDSNFIFGQVAALGPVAEVEPPTVAMHEWMGLDGDLQQFWGMAFIFRPVGKLFGFIALGLFGLVLLAYALPGVRRLTGMVGGVR